VTEPWLLTSRYSEPALAVFPGAKIKITVGHPRFRLKYTLLGAIKELAPFGLMSKDLSPDEFEQLYRARLDSFGVDHILGLLEATRALTPSGLVVALCFERVGEPCHRRALARYLEDRIGLVVPELDPADWLSPTQTEEGGSRP
jgi:hypothetical protein